MPAKKSLLEIAKSRRQLQPRSKNYTEEQIELALAWANDDITLQQVQHALEAIGTNKGNVYTFLALCLKSIISTRK
jgi:hypothetical protein